MKRLFYSTILCFLWLLNCPAQEKPVCPSVKLIRPEKAVVSGEPMLFSVSPGREIKDRGLEFEWEVTAGLITEGQGTTDIRVDTAGLDDTPVVASVQVEGLPAGCSNRFSAAGTVRKTPPNNDAFLHCFDRIGPAEEKMRLDAVAARIISSEDKRLTAHFYIRTGSSRPPLREINAFFSRTLDHLVSKRKVAKNRIIFLVVRDDTSGIRFCPWVTDGSEFLCEACQLIKAEDFRPTKNAPRK